MKPGKTSFETPEPSGSISLRCGLIWILTLFLLASQLPVFVQQSLTPDTVLYDLQARCLLNGGVLYRDILEPNLPGIVWVHALVRSLIGWSSPALLAFDLVVVLAIGSVLARLARIGCGRSDKSQTVLALTMPGVLLFYLGTSEWCHCQRDTWMLLPCLIALLIRIKVMRELPMITDRTPRFTAQQFAWGIFEGVFWAGAFWLKPFIAVPAVVVLLVSVRYSKSFGCWGQHTLSVILGGLLTGSLGVLWMVRSGCWPYFLDQLTQWNGDYFQSGRTRWTLDRYIAHAMRFQPWIWLHVAAIGISLKQLFGDSRKSQVSQSAAGSSGSGLLNALYLGWILQAFLLQQFFDYIHVPGILLTWAICVRSVSVSLASEDIPAAWRKLAFPVIAVFLCVALIASPVSSGSRKELWLQCIHACFGSPLSPESQDQIAQIPFPRWTELQPMINHIHETGITDGTLIAYNGNLIHLYPELGFQPGTRFVYLDVLARCFPDRRTEMIEAVEKSGARYVVSDLREDGWNGELPDAVLLPEFVSESQTMNWFPYNQTPLFRSGGYVLFRIERPVECLSGEYLPLANAPQNLKRRQSP